MIQELYVQNLNTLLDVTFSNEHDCVYSRTHVLWLSHKIMLYVGVECIYDSKTISLYFFNEWISSVVHLSTFYLSRFFNLHLFFYRFCANQWATNQCFTKITLKMYVTSGLSPNPGQLVKRRNIWTEYYSDLKVHLIQQDSA